MFTVLLVFHLLVAVALTGLILMQHGKGADMGAAFGSGASGTVFGARGSANFLSRTTAILATVFFATSIALAMLARSNEEPRSVTELAPAQEAEVPAPAEEPAIPAPAEDEAAPAEGDAAIPAPAEAPASE